ncbi:MAG TPA: gamma-glutamyltransferase family protein [Steroidobacteraceae bacterium]|nr:gamma-glutamyltransferase family protein [Steroidobacteraceae bacterium]
MTELRARAAGCAIAAVALLGTHATAVAQSAPPQLSTCDTAAQAPFCAAVPGVRAEGWLPQSRSEVMAQHGMVVTSQPLAAQAGLQVLRRGGNAIDAAVATAAALNVTEPMMTGIGGDLFAMIYVAKEHKLYVLNASGTAPSGATLAHFESLGYRRDPENWGPGSGMPTYGILPVTVPGAVWGWSEVLKRFGKLTFKEVLAPAIDYATHGFPVSERIAHDWQLPNALPLRGCCQQPDPDSLKVWYLAGKPPTPGQIFRNPDLAHTFWLLQQGGRDVFYKGEIARAIVAKSSALGGTMTNADLANYHGEWVEPASLAYHGFEVLELPPPSQAWAAEEILSILQTCLPKWTPRQTLASLGPTNPRYWHVLVEAKKLAYADLFAYNADPNFSHVPYERLISSAHAASLCGKVDLQHASVPARTGIADAIGDTIVLSTADREGNMVSWVNSNYSEFGSGITVPGYGFILHDRGALFSLDGHSPNAIAPGKRPFNTLSAGFVFRDEQPVMTVTLMGGDMQAQGHAQLLVDILDLGANLQAAADMARFRHSQIRNSLHLESPLFDLVGRQLAALGHNVRAANGAEMGGVQVILFTPNANQRDASRSDSPDALVNGFYRGGSDRRKDGQAVGW